LNFQLDPRPSKIASRLAVLI